MLLATGWSHQAGERQVTCTENQCDRCTRLYQLSKGAGMTGQRNMAGGSAPDAGRNGKMRRSPPNGSGLTSGPLAPLLTEAEVAAKFKIPPKTLREWRYRGRGHPS